MLLPEPDLGDGNYSAM